MSEGRLHLHIDPVSGVAGDMLLGAVLDLGVTVDALREGLVDLGLDDVTFRAAKERRLGLAGTRAQVLVQGDDAGGAWLADEHGHRHLDELVPLIEGAASMPAPVRRRAVEAYVALADAEAHAHGTTRDKVALHEVGAADALIDLCGSLLGLHLLGVTTVSCGPVPLGSGTVRCAHGVMPIPVPAVTALLADIPTVAGAGTHPTGELSTPTGVAVLRAVVDHFGPPPPMRLERVGVGLGTRDREDVPNVVRLLLGTRTGSDAPEAQDVLVLTTSVDDLDGRVVPRVVERLLTAGALDVFTAMGQGKKGRPALRLEVIVPDDSARDAVSEVLFRETPTLGLRWRREQRTTLTRAVRTVQTDYGAVRVKEGRFRDEVVTSQPELEDCLALAEQHGVPLRTVLHAANLAATWAVGDGSNPE